jgi:putative ABC transport system permease protein
MGAVRMKAVADLRRRRLQSVVVGLVLFLSTAAGTLALSVLVESHAPFEHAFEAANGAHIVVRFGGDVDPARIAATATTAPVTASAGPWPVADGSVDDPKGHFRIPASFSGRPAPDASIDAVTMEAGRWWQGPGEAVLDQTAARLLQLTVGDVLSILPSAGPTNEGSDPAASPGGPAHDLTIVGIARSVSTPDVTAWMSPTDIASLVAPAIAEQEMLYRVTPSATAADLAAATTAIAAALPADAVTSRQTYLDVKAGVDQLADLYVPVLLAFSIFALLAAAFMIANVVSGVILTSYRDIGVMKAVGYTPGQVSAILLGQVLVPATLGSVAGVIVGTFASEPIVSDTASSFGLPTAYTLSLPVMLAVLGVALATCIVAALVPSLRAGRISAVSAMTRGVAPSTRPGGGRLRRMGLALPVGLAGRLGISAGLAHPVRATMTLGALVVGVAAATFALGLDWSLLRVQTDLDRAVASPVRADAQGGGKIRIGVEGSGGVDGVEPSTTAGEVTALIAATPGTGRSVTIGEAEVTAAGLGAVPFVGYDGDSSWLGYALIQGSWFAGPGEAVASTYFFTQSGLHLGDVATISLDGRSVSVRLVGEVFDSGSREDGNLVLRGAWADLAVLDPTVTARRWEIQPADGVDVEDYRSSLQDALGNRAGVYSEDESSDASFILFLTVVGLMGLVLVVMALGGVFDTVLLETRQRTHEVAVLKAIGLAPAQVVSMVIATIVPVGLVAGLIGVPLGLVAQRVVLAYMGEVAAHTGIPPSVYDVFTPLALLGLASLGLVIGALGAYLPAQRAALARIAPVLQAE